MIKVNKLFATALLSAALVFAQRGPRPDGGTPPDPAAMIQRRVDMLSNFLTLTEAQKARAATIFTDAMTAGQALHSSSQSAHTALAAAVKKNDLGGIDQYARELGTISGQLTAIESKADAAFYALLTPDQQTKYDSKPRGGPGRMRGPGGPGPEGFGRNR
ncbi:MAG TPA: Spy/CpxP family protein refolding chaperone [Bryobacteraceae bacterium]|nr:Spy/CpxP family protein refolding chaperone [Bryobacteraceae bacterium]